MRCSTQILIAPALALVAPSAAIANQPTQVENPCEAIAVSSGWVKTLRVFEWDGQIKYLRRLDHAATGLGFSLLLTLGEEPDLDGPDIDAIIKSEGVENLLEGLPASEPDVHTRLYDGELTVMIDSLEGGPQWTMKGKLERTRLFDGSEFITTYAVADRLPRTGTVQKLMSNLAQGGEFRITITITTGVASMHTLYSGSFESAGFVELGSSRGSPEQAIATSCPLLR